MQRAPSPKRQLYPQRPERLTELEAVRGIAAVVVLVHHCLLGFMPSVSGLVVPAQPWSLFGTPFFALINGSAAVVVFFVLSGFVLTYRAIETGEPRLLAAGALKRWPRLAFPVLIVNASAGLLFALGLYANLVADSATGSIWLGWMYLSNPYPAPALAAAGYEGAVAAFLFMQVHFNPSLWTMHYEFFGSFLAFALAYLWIGGRTIHLFAAAILAIAACRYFSAYSLCFFAGVGMAAARHHLRLAVPARRRSWTTAAGLTLAFFLFGYHEHVNPAPMRFYEFLAPVAIHAPLAFRVTLHTIGAVIVLLVALEFGEYLRGPLAARLGQLSFPIYLLHIPVLCSAGCATYLFGLREAGHPAAAIAATVAVIAITFALAVPLARIDRFWLTFLRRLAMPRTGMHAAAQTPA